MSFTIGGVYGFGATVGTIDVSYGACFPDGCGDNLDSISASSYFNGFLASTCEFNNFISFLASSSFYIVSKV